MKTGRLEEERTNERRRYYRRLSEIDVPWNEGVKRMRTRDERAERERQIDGTNGQLERNRRGGRMKEVAIYALQKSLTKRGLVLSMKDNRQERQRGDERLKRKGWN